MEPHGLTPVAPRRARGAEPRRSRVLLRRGLVGTASQQHPRFAFRPALLRRSEAPASQRRAQGRGVRRRRV